MSPVFGDFYVYDSKDAVIALDKIAETKKLPVHFIDRHLAAFLLEKDPRAIDPYLYDLDSSIPDRVVLASLACLGMIQSRNKIGSLPHLANDLMDGLKPVYERYHDREKRDELEKKIVKIAARGDLSEMAKVLKDPISIRQDKDGFDAAVLSYRALQVEYDGHIPYLKDKKKFSDNFGRGTAAVLSCVVSCIIVVMIILTQIVG
jgi:hypothetical protein